MADCAPAWTGGVVALYILLWYNLADVVKFGRTMNIKELQQGCRALWMFKVLDPSLGGLNLKCVCLFVLSFKTFWPLSKYSSPHQGIYECSLSLVVNWFQEFGLTWFRYWTMGFNELYVKYRKLIILMPFCLAWTEFSKRLCDHSFCT